MPVFTTAAAYIATTIGVSSAVGLAAINFGVRAVASYVLTSLMSKRSGPSSNSPEVGNRTQLPPASDNKLPVVYGSAFISPMLVDAKISIDQTTMWYVMALTEKTDTGEVSFDRQYWGDKELFFDGSDPTKIAYWINSNDQTSTVISGNMFIYYFSDGSNSPANGTESAIQILQDANIASDERWTADHLMSDTTFAIVKIIYNQQANVTGLEQFKVQLTNTLKQPGSVIKDYLTNTRYGCAIPIANVDIPSLSLLDVYSAEPIPYIDVNGNPATQARYQINGPFNTNNDCLTNLQQMVDSCDSWLQWDEVEGNWGVVINQSFTDYTTLEELFLIDSNNIIGGVDVTPIDLNSTFNSIEGQFPNFRVSDKTDYTYTVIDMEDRNPNEPDNQLVIQLPQVNNSIQATYLATRRLIQSREDLIVNMSIDYSGIQIEAGDVVRVQQPVYGWGPLPSNPSNPDKLFRVTQVVEAKSEDGSLGARVSLTEYNEQVYQNIDISDYIPATNTGIADPGWISTPGAPVVTIKTPSYEGETSSFEVSATVPAEGLVLYMDFNFGTDSNPSTHKLYKTVTPSSGRAFVNGITVMITVNDLPPGTYYWSIVARGASQTSSTESSEPSAPSPWAGMKILAPLLVAGQLLGGIGRDLLRPDAQTSPSIIKTLYFNPTGAVDGIIPDITTLPLWDRNRSCTIPGVLVPPGQIFPWYQGTGSGTGPFMPPANRALIVSEGEYGWYKAIYWSVLDDPVIPDVDYFNISMSLVFLSDTPNTKFQICPFAKFTEDVDENSVDIQQGSSTFGTFNIVDSEPYPFTVTINDFDGTTGATGVQIGYMIRNMTPGSTLTLVNGAGVYDAKVFPHPFIPVNPSPPAI